MPAANTSNVASSSGPPNTTVATALPRAVRPSKLPEQVIQPLSATGSRHVERLPVVPQRAQLTSTLDLALDQSRIALAQSVLHLQHSARDFERRCGQELATYDQELARYDQDLRRRDREELERLNCYDQELARRDREELARYDQDLQRRDWEESERYRQEMDRYGARSQGP